MPDSDSPAGAPAARERLETIVLLGGVLALDGADKAAVGAIAHELKPALEIGNLGIGMLVAASTAVGALTTLPLGALVDRVPRVRLLAAAIFIWSAAMLVSGCVDSFAGLLVSRLALGGIVAIAAPAVASLTGDFFPSAERGRIWGYLLTGELIGSAVGLALCGALAGLFSWRAAFWVLGAIGLVFACIFVWRVVEPERGGQARLPPTRMPSDDDEPSIGEPIHAREDITASGVGPRETDPAHLSFRQALRYVVSIRTNMIIIVASALGYFFFTGLRSFGVTLIAGRFDLSQSMASLTTVALGMGSIVGVLVAGRLTDRLIGQGRLNARIIVPACALFGCAAFLIPGVLATTLWITAPMFFISAGCFGATNPPLDAARLDIVHSHVWGRAEGVRTLLRNVFEAAAPLAFGLVSTLLGSASGVFEARHDTGGNAQGLAWTFLIMSSALVAGGLILLRARKTYVNDVADAEASERATIDT